MARKPRLEVEGGLYHLIARGVDRRDIFHEPEDYGKFLVSLATQKEKLPFHLYAYCLMTNHLNRRICRQRSSLRPSQIVARTPRRRELSHRR